MALLSPSLTQPIQSRSMISTEARTLRNHFKSKYATRTFHTVCHVCSTGLDLPKVGRISGFQFVRCPFRRGEQTSTKERRDEHAFNHKQARENFHPIKQIKSKPSFAKMVLHQYTYIFVIGTFFALLDAFNNGASE